jgi:hypothetical protein
MGANIVEIFHSVKFLIRTFAKNYLNENYLRRNELCNSQ